jgi:hypothetical protein
LVSCGHIIFYASLDGAGKGMAKKFAQRLGPI